MIAIETLTAEAVREVRAFTPNCFANLLSQSLEVSIGSIAASRISIEPAGASLQARGNPEGTEFRLDGLMTVSQDGKPDVDYDVCIIGLHDGDDIGFRSIQNNF